jgi:hypothetical protein
MYCNKNLRTVNLQKEIARDKTKSFYRNISRLSALFIFDGLPSQILIGTARSYVDVCTQRRRGNLYMDCYDSLYVSFRGGDILYSMYDM